MRRLCDVSDSELDRIRAEYEARDAAADSPYRWDNPGYVTYMQGLERALLRAFAAAGVELAGLSVLDVGCGSGYFLHRLHEYGAGSCHGIDLSEGRIRDARERYPSLSWRAGSATDLPFADGELDLVSQFTCLSSIVDDEVRLAAAREMKRVSGAWVLSVDTRPAGSSRAGTPTVAMDETELKRLFGEPALLRRAPVNFGLAQMARGHDLVARGLAALWPLRSHYIGLWRSQR